MKRFPLYKLLRRMTRAHTRSQGISIAALGRELDIKPPSMRRWAWVDDKPTDLKPENLERLLGILIDAGYIRIEYDIRKIERLEAKPPAPMKRARATK